MSYVYFILDIISNAVKIGKANDVFDRLSTLQTGNPNELVLLGYTECSSEKHSFLIEKQYHQKFKDLHINGEWFRYEEKTFKNFILNESNIKTKSKRQPLTINTLWGEEVVRDIETHPHCYFYSELVAQIKENYEKSLKLKLPFRTMRFPTDGKKMLLPYSTEVNRVFISARKHNENRKQKKFEKESI